MENLSDIFKKNPLLGVIIVNAIIAALVGAAFGYYGASLAGNQAAPISLFKRPATVSQAPATTDDEARIIEVVKKSSPAVVSIVATKDLTFVEQGRVNPFRDFCDDPFFRQFLGDQCNLGSQPSQPRTERREVGAGTGFIISAPPAGGGLVLTNKHVVDLAGADFTVITSNNKKFPAKIVAKDPVQDLAILKIDAGGLGSLPLGDSSKLQIGQTVIAIGNALGQFSNTVSKGVISGLSRSIVASGGSTSEKLEQVIQTDAAINPGNSGGPLLNLAGEVIGVNTAIVQGAQNIGFAIPINQAKRDIDQVKKIGRISYPFVGIRYLIVNDEVKKERNLTVNYGALIVRGQNPEDQGVVPNSPAGIAGLKEDDIILEFNGKKITQDNDLARMLQSHNAGDTVRLKVLSQSKEKIVSLVLAERTQ